MEIETSYLDDNIYLDELYHQFEIQIIFEKYFIGALF
jgi:hypothetical protein